MVWAMRIINSIVILLTLGIIFIPIKWYYDKPVNETALHLLVKETSHYDWFLQHLKVTDVGDLEDANFVIISDADTFSQDFLETIKHEIVLYDHLFSTLDEITYKQDLLDDVTGISFSGYIGKTYPALDQIEDIPVKIIENYEKKTGEPWQFTGEGIVISHLDDVIVLERDIDYTYPVTLEADGKRIPYYGLFEITSHTEGATSLATFQTHLTPRGKNRFKGYQLPTSFSAFYEIKKPLYTAYYTAGNFSDYHATVPYNHELIPDILGHKGLYELYAQEQVFWQWFYPTLATLIEQPQDHLIPEVTSDTIFRIKDKEIYLSGTDEPFFVKGLNFGAALPNQYFTEFPKDKTLYLKWFSQMKGMHVNTIRIYTLMPPVFYEALYTFNQTQSEPLYLLQEIWPEENPTLGNYLADDYNYIYHQEIAYVVNAIHGNENIPERLYRAYGLYQYDVSPYLLGYLVGRELEPEEVAATDTLNEGYRFKGDYFFGDAIATPTENWLASACDYTLEMSAAYGSLPLVGIVNWPTLDPMEHDSERPSGDGLLKAFNDRETVNIDHISITDPEKSVGFFGAYHIYPNYPDFMNNDEHYDAYYDDEGRFRYGGYLSEFMAQHKKYPAIVAEYGLSTSMVTSHFNPDGYNHGGLNERQQGEGIIRMTKAIVNEGYSGAIIFEWMDEWAKKTWTTEPFMIPYLNNPYWHNLLDPEQNYGILQYLSDKDLTGKTAYRNDEEMATVARISTNQDASALYIYIEFNNASWSNKPFELKISTPSEPDIQDEDYWEFILRYAPMGQTAFSDTVDLTASSLSPEYSKPYAELRVNPGYDWPNGRYRASDETVESYIPLQQLVNGENTTKSGTYTPAKYEQLGQINIGSLTVPQNQIAFEQTKLTLKLPYGQLGISDPTTKRILADARYYITAEQDKIMTKSIDDIKFNFVIEDEVIPFEMELVPWTNAPTTTRLKSSYEIIGDYFKTLE